MAKIIPITSKVIPEKFKDIDGIGIYQINNSSKIVIARGLGGPKDEVSKGIEHILMPYKKNNGILDLKLQRGCLIENRLPRKIDFSDFPFLNGFINFPKYGEFSLFKTDILGHRYTKIAHDEEILLSLYVYINISGKEGYLHIPEVKLNFDREIGYRTEFFTESKGEYYKDLSQLDKLKIYEEWEKF